MKAIMYAPKCSVCSGSGLTLDELHECSACMGYGRGEGLMQKMIERTSDQVAREHEAAASRPSYKISDYQQPDQVGVRQ